MNSIVESPLVWLAVAALMAAAAFAAGMRLGVRRAKVVEPGPEPAPAVDLRSIRRATALDALAEAVLITDRQGRVSDCNSSALTLFDRHRGSIEEQFASALRRFDGLDQDEPYRLAAERAVWTGEAWTRQPDGAAKLCQARVIAVRDERARVTGFAESYRDVSADREDEKELRDLLYGVRAFDAAGRGDEDGVMSVRDDLRMLSEGFRDLEHVLRQYERLLPSLGADDPLSESIAGAASDARTAVASVGVSSLLDQIPRALSRLRGHLQALATDRASSADAPLGTQDGDKPRD